MIESLAIPDSDIRHLAETNFDQNVVVVAGAGTGKTTLLVNRLLTALLREPDPIPITKIVALTFTNKAATELKIRLQDQLLALVDWEQREKDNKSVGSVRLSEYQERYRLSVQQIVARAKEALDNIEKAQIGTLHSFAAHLLRLHPLESGVPPTFQEDDGSRFEEYFSQEWDLWIHHELSLHGDQHEQWRTFLSYVRLEQIRDLALDLCRECPSLDMLEQQAEWSSISESLRAWCIEKRDCVSALRAMYELPKPRKIESILRLVQDVFEHVLTKGLTEEFPFEIVAQKELLFAPVGKMPSGWTDEHFTEARGAIRIVQAFFSVEHRLIHGLLGVLIPFVKNVQEGFVNGGWITFHGLLTRARSLLRDYPLVRKRLKQEYRAVLVDEFQDTDPIQYEIVLYLCEEPGQSALDWQGVRLVPGKLFIVGDPKQSIYAFRGADLEAFDHVVKKIQDSGGVVYELLTNFRSHHGILGVVNEIFNRLFQPLKHIQPGNIPLVVRPDRDNGRHYPGVEIHLVKTDDSEEGMDTSSVSRLEADQLSRWIKEELLDRDVWIEAQGERLLLRPGHIGLLFRKLTQAQVYLEALRRHGIPYVTDGEKHFYRRQEVIDLINVLRVVESPRDTVAMLGVLRSSLGGLNDREIYELRQREAFDCREREHLDGWTSQKAKEVKRLYEILANLHETAFCYPLVEMIDIVLSRLPVLELAAASEHGEQAVANLMKVRMMAMELVDRPYLTLTKFVNLLANRLEQQPSEAERALVEESLDAVRILTIHKAKGLEFPVVILPGVHHGAQTGYEGPSVSYDWATDILGVSIGGFSTLGAVLTKEKIRVKEEAEQRRLLYVAMTRAQERLILSGGVPKLLARGAFLGLLQRVVDRDVGNPDCDHIRIGSASCPQILTSSSERIPMKGRKESVHELKRSPDLTAWLDSWAERDKTWRVLHSTPTYLTPTSQKKDEHQARKLSRVEGSLGHVGTLIGTLIHRVLEGWNFEGTVDMLKERVDMVCEYGIPPDHIGEWQVIREELNKVFDIFLSSPLYETLTRATVLGREVPFTILWDCDQNNGQAIKDRMAVMEGVIDLVYQVDGQVYLADYKTEYLTKEDIPARITYYQEQTAIYKEAAQRCLGLNEVICQLFFLRLGKSVQV